MPTTINGIGTNYAGKSNVEVRHDVCEHCNRPAQLTSYDTRLFFVVLFIPLIPLGKKRIFDQCSVCSRHRAMPLHQYEQLASDTLGELEAEHRNDPGNVDKAIEYNAALFQFNRKPEGLAHVGDLLRSFPDRAQVQFYGGAVYEQQGEGQAATRCFDRAYELAPDNPAISRAKAIQLIEQGDLSAGRALLRSRPDEHWDLGAMVLLAKSYQAKGDHTTAMEIYREILLRVPGVAQDKGFRKLVKASEKMTGRHGSILPGRQLPLARLTTVGLLVAAVLGGGYAWNFYRMSHHELQVVNGFPGELRVTLDGDQQVAFQTAGRSTVHVGEGQHRAEVSGPFTESIDFEIRRTFWQRFAGDPIWVLNPGGLGIVAWEETVYSTGSVDNYEPRYQLHGGQSFQRFDDVDYPFEEFPDSISMSSSTSRVTKSRLHEIVGSPDTGAAWFFNLGAARDSLAYLERWLEIAPTDGLALTYASASKMASAQQRASEFLRPRLSTDPVNVEWHRAYQHAAEDLPHGTEQLVAEYDQLLAESPQDPALLYLRGRVEPDPRAALTYYARAIERDPRHLRAKAASAYTSLGVGDYAGAVRMLASANEQEDVDVDVQELYYDALLAARQFDRLEQLLRPQLSDGVEHVDWSRAGRLVELLVVQGRGAEAKETISRVAELDTRLAGQETGLETWLLAQLAYFEADWRGLERYLGQHRLSPLLERRFAFWLAVETNDLEKATQLAKSGIEDGEEAMQRLVVSLMNARAGITGLADQWLQQGLESLGNSTEATTFAALLEGEIPATRANLDRIVTDPSLKAVLLAVLASRHPEQRIFRSEAERFDVDLGFPHHFLASLGKEEAAAG